LTKILEEMGEDIKLARLRRKLTTGQVAERAGISRSTLWQVEKGLASVSFGNLCPDTVCIGTGKGFTIDSKR
jgi:DNA-binding XRE family transcriptional regulator